MDITNILDLYLGRFCDWLLKDERLNGESPYDNLSLEEVEILSKELRRGYELAEKILTFNNIRNLLPPKGTLIIDVVNHLFWGYVAFGEGEEKVRNIQQRLLHPDNCYFVNGDSLFFRR